jgi:hypothetical protein
VSRIPPDSVSSDSSRVTIAGLLSRFDRDFGSITVSFDPVIERTIKIARHFPIDALSSYSYRIVNLWEILQAITRRTSRISHA